MMKKLLLATIAFTALIAAPAVAAELPLKAPRLAAIPVPGFSWTGCYIGGHVGGAWVSKEFNGQFGTTEASFFAPPTPFALSDNNSGISSQGGVLSGAQAGCNYQYASNWVIGIDGDTSWTATTAGIQQNEFANVLATTPPQVAGATSALVNSTGNLSFKTDFIATLTGRLGYTWDRTMIYAKGGAAWARDKYNFNGQVTSAVCILVMNGPPPACGQFNPAVATPFNFNASETRLGWTIGGGFEWAFSDNWSTKLEYDFMDFGFRNVTFTDGALGQQNISIRQRISEVKLGLNYRFNYLPFVGPY